MTSGVTLAYKHLGTGRSAADAPGQGNTGDLVAGRGTAVALLLLASCGVGAEAREAQVPALFGTLCNNVVVDAKVAFDCSLTAL